MLHSFDFLRRKNILKEIFFYEKFANVKDIFSGQNQTDKYSKSQLISIFLPGIWEQVKQGLEPETSTLEISILLMSY